MSKSIDLKRLSRVLCFALRHSPVALGLCVDERGAVDVAELLSVLRLRYPGWRSLSARHLAEVVCLSGHQRFEIEAGRIRALYGHSAAVCRTRDTPPTVLYHGTRAELLEPIFREGLRPMRRSHVQLTTSTLYARRVVRAQSEPVLLAVHAVAASSTGISFFRASALVWLAEPIPPRFLTVNDVAAGPATSAERRDLVRGLFTDETSTDHSTR